MVLCEFLYYATYRLYICQHQLKCVTIKYVNLELFFPKVTVTLVIVQNIFSLLLAYFLSHGRTIKLSLAYHSVLIRYIFRLENNIKL